MRRHFIVPGLLVLLLALLGLNRIVADYRYVLSGETGELLYAATFDDFTDEWQQYQGRLEAQITGGVMRLDFDNPNDSAYSAALPNFADFELRAQARAVDGPENNGFGVVFRLRDPQNFYVFLVSSDGYYQVRRRVSGETKTLSAWIPSPAINQGIDVTNRMRVFADGDAFQFFVNGEQLQLCVPDNPAGESTYDAIAGECVEGQMVDTLVDDAVGIGQIGVVVQTLNEPEPVVVEFDNILVFGMDEDT